MTENDDDERPIHFDDIDAADIPPGQRKFAAVLAVGYPKGVNELEAAYGAETIVPQITFVDDEDGTLSNWRDYPELTEALGRRPTVAEADAYTEAMHAAENERRARMMEIGRALDELDMIEAEDK